MPATGRAGLPPAQVVLAVVIKWSMSAFVKTKPCS